MRGAQPWQIIVIIACLLAAGVMVYINLSGQEKMEFADSMMVADIQTGELFELALGKKARVMPMTRPGGSVPTLFPVEQREGKWFIEQRYLEGGSEGLKTSKVVDSKTGEVQVTGPAKELNP